MPAGGRGDFGCEVLVRLRNPDGSLAAPEKFFDTTERHELMPALDRWVVAATLELLRGRSADAGKIMLNVSRQSLLSDQFREFLAERLEQSGVDPGLLCLELSESTALGGLPDAERFLRGVVSMGCSVALDDFGRGLSSLAHLKRLPVQYLKIDGTLIRRCWRTGSASRSPSRSRVQPRRSALRRSPSTSRARPWPRSFGRSVSTAARVSTSAGRRR